MIRTLVFAGMLALLLCGTALSSENEWLVVTTWDNQKITLGDFGFYRSFDWNQVSKYKEYDKKIVLDYAGAHRETRLRDIRTITNQLPEFTEHFYKPVIELVDGTVLTCERIVGVSGVMGWDMLGMVRIPGRRIQTIEFVRPPKEEESSSGGT